MKTCKYCNKLETKELVFVSDEHKCIPCRNLLRKRRYNTCDKYRELKLEINIKSRKKRDKELHNKYHREYYIKNHDKLKTNKKFYSANRRAKELERTPSWTTEPQLHNIKETYKLASIMSKHSLLDFHVDHIIPLQGNIVSGLHTPSNLQILDSGSNLSKNNSFKA